MEIYNDNSEGDAFKIGALSLDLLTRTDYAFLAHKRAFENFKKGEVM